MKFIDLNTHSLLIVNLKEQEMKSFPIYIEKADLAAQIGLHHDLLQVRNHRQAMEEGTRVTCLHWTTGWKPLLKKVFDMEQYLFCRCDQNVSFCCNILKSLYAEGCVICCGIDWCFVSVFILTHGMWKKKNLC